MKKPYKRRMRLPSSRIGINCQKGLASLVLPVYNGEKYLAEAIESVLAQTSPLWELIIVDDGSTDTSAQIAMEYAEKDARIRLYRQENQKLPAALNRGFSLAKGEFYGWLSADNRLLPEFLAVMRGELSKNPKTDMVFGNQYLIDEEGKRITGHGWFENPPRSGAVCFPPATPLLNVIPNNTIGAAFLYRAAADTVLGGYSPLLFLLEDYDYFMRMNSLLKIRHIKRRAPIYEYRMHPDSLTAHDEELSITASRPKLMEYDAYRRRRYGHPIPIAVCGAPPQFLKKLCKAGLFPMERDAEISLCFGEAASCAGICYRISTGKEGYTVFYDDQSSVLLKSARDCIAFLRLRALCDLLRQEESEFF